MTFFILVVYMHVFVTKTLVFIIWFKNVLAYKVQAPKEYILMLKQSARVRLY